MALRRDQGFSLIELVVVLSIIALLAAIAVPRLLAARAAADEVAALSTMRTIVAAQVQFQQASRADTDADGAGEYGGFLELSGQIAGRQTAVLKPSVLSGTFRILNAAGEVTRGGYLFRVYLPDASGAGIGEPLAGFADDGTVDSDHAETGWCCYAWPVHRRGTEGHTYFANQMGFVTSTRDASYAGTGAGPAPDAAFLTAGSILGPIALKVAGSDGNLWKHAY